MIFEKKNNIQKIANSILSDMGGDARKVCTGECTTFAMRLVDALGEGNIVNASLSNAMLSDFEKYEEKYKIVKAGYTEKNIPHCYVQVEDLFFDAFDTQGVDDEAEMEYLNNF